MRRSVGRALMSQEYSSTNPTQKASRLADGIAWALAAKVTSRDKVVLIALLQYADRETGECYPGLARLSDDTGLSVSSVSKSIGALVKAGLIVVTKEWKRNFYRLSFSKTENDHLP